jgi:hypothetical protein
MNAADDRLRDLALALWTSRERQQFKLAGFFAPLKFEATRGMSQ